MHIHRGHGMRWHKTGGAGAAVALLLSLLLGEAHGAGARALREDRDAFNGAVHGDPVPDDPAMQGEQYPDGGWIELDVLMPFAIKPHYTPVQYRIDDGYVSMRGWVVAKTKAREGTLLFTLPPEAAPGRVETFNVNLKGQDRRISANPDGTVKLDLAMEWNQWLPLAGFSFHSWTAYEDTGGAKEVGDGGSEEL